MIHIYPESNLESRLALGSVLEGNKDKQLTEKKSKNNIANNLVHVCAFKENQNFDGGTTIAKSVGSGLLITEDGWIVTSYHVIEKYLDDWKRIMKEEPLTKTKTYYGFEGMKYKYSVLDQNKNLHPLDLSVYSYIPTLDIALVKAITNKKPEPIKFKIVKKGLKKKDWIKLLALKRQRLHMQFGKIISASREAPLTMSEAEIIVKDTFLTNAYGVPGYSGGVFTTPKGELAGLVSYISDAQKCGNTKIGYAGGIKARYIIELIKKTAEFGSQKDLLNLI